MAVPRPTTGKWAETLEMGTTGGGGGEGGVMMKHKWAKYCPISRDYRTMEEWEFLEKHETCYHDYVSCHIKARRRGKEEEKEA